MLCWQGHAGPGRHGLDCNSACSVTLTRSPSVPVTEHPYVVVDVLLRSVWECAYAWQA
jgi:hypothetical protein